ncbi:hypothetical protein FMN63_29060 [Stappia sp. BW2]|uniref:hypothetical protein n=1 Tax=Stappia sp. BW2 TaxID=2592622 RepID=UPI0011DEFE54|nr:hypothetical protein [Stappia sp. BW2]TYC63106.1 hypothetical protein FMN63_29060 [Stappia sp. BW2]
MTKILAVMSLLATPFAIFFAFDWKGLLVAILALVVYALVDFRRFRREENWRKIPLNQALRSFGRYNFSLANALGKEVKIDPVTIIPDSFSPKKRDDTLYIISQYEDLLSKFESAVKDFEHNMKLRKGSSVSGEEFLIFINELEEALFRIKTEYSPKFSLEQSRSAFFDELASRLSIGEDFRGDYRWGDPQKVKKGKRFYRQKGSLDLLYFENSSSDKIWITVGAQELDISDFFPNRIDECISRIKEITS